LFLTATVGRSGRTRPVPPTASNIIGPYTCAENVPTATAPAPPGWCDRRLCQVLILDNSGYFLAYDYKMGVGCRRLGPQIKKKEVEYAMKDCVGAVIYASPSHGLPFPSSVVVPPSPQHTSELRLQA